MTGVLLDIDGVLHVSGEPIPGAKEAVRRLRDDGHPLRFVTNNTTRPRSRLAAELRALGFEVAEDEIETTPLAAVRLLEGRRVLALTMSAVHDDLAGHVELVREDVDVVLLGGADETEDTVRVFGYENLNLDFG